MPLCLAPGRCTLQVFVGSACIEALIGVSETKISKLITKTKTGDTSKALKKLKKTVTPLPDKLLTLRSGIATLRVSREMESSRCGSGSKSGMKGGSGRAKGVVTLVKYEPVKEADLQALLAHMHHS